MEDPARQTSSILARELHRLVISGLGALSLSRQALASQSLIKRAFC